MHETITDWRGEIRALALVGATVRLVLRYPVSTLVWPVATLAIARWSNLETAVLSGIPLPLLNRWTSTLVRPELWLATPIVALAWVRVARAAVAPERPARGWLMGTLFAVGAGIVVLAAADVAGVYALVLVGLFATVVPARACGSGKNGLGWRLMSGHRWRWLVGLVLLQAGLGLVYLCSLVGVLTLAPVLSPAFLHGALVVFYEGLAVGLTMALSAATYAALKRRHDLDDAERWVEAFQ